MKCIKRFLKKLDIFGSPINFKYKSQDRYSTSFGGLFLLIFSLISIIFGLYYFIPFFEIKKYEYHLLYNEYSKNRKN